MKTVKTKKELIDAIKSGEKEVYVDSKRLFVACMMAEKYRGSSSELTSKSPKVLGYEMGLVVEMTEAVAIALIISALLIALAIIVVLGDLELDIETERDEKTGKLKGRVKMRKRKRNF